MRLRGRKSPGGDERDQGSSGPPPVYNYLKGSGFLSEPGEHEPEPAAEAPPVEAPPPPAPPPEAEPPVSWVPDVAEEAAAAEVLEEEAAPLPPEPGARSRLRGWSLPLSPSGESSLVPAPPWHYSGDLMVVEYRVEPDAARSFLPPELDLGDDPGAAAAIFADWQSCSDSMEELLDPVRAQYREFFIVLAAQHRGQPVTRCPLMWVDRGFSLARGWIQGFPKKPGSIAITRAVHAGRAGPRLAPGHRFGATCASNDRRIAEATLTLRRLSETGPTINTPPLVNTRFIPPWDPDGGRLDEHVYAGGRDRESTPAWEGDATLAIFDSPTDEIGLLKPVEIGKGFWFSFGYTVDGGKRLT